MESFDKKNVFDDDQISLVKLTKLVNKIGLVFKNVLSRIGSRENTEIISNNGYYTLCSRILPDKRGSFEKEIKLKII